jgi:hypothetical protein
MVEEIREHKTQTTSDLPEKKSEMALQGESV